jgi:hypothetical protein
VKLIAGVVGGVVVVVLMVVVSLVMKKGRDGIDARPLIPAETIA